jgi:hypothetical protein
MKLAMSEMRIFIADGRARLFIAGAALSRRRK